MLDLFNVYYQFVLMQSSSRKPSQKAAYTMVKTPSQRVIDANKGVSKLYVSQNLRVSCSFVSFYSTDFIHL